MKTVNYEINLPEFDLDEVNMSLYDVLNPRLQKLDDTLSDLKDLYV